MRDVVHHALARDAWEVWEAENGHVAMGRMPERRPAVLLLDLMMPEIDGMGVLERMSADPELAEIPVVVLTAADLSRSELDALSQRVAHVMDKGQRDRDSLLSQVRQRVAECVKLRRASESQELK